MAKGLSFSQTKRARDPKFSLRGKKSLGRADSRRDVRRIQSLIERHWGWLEDPSDSEISSLAKHQGSVDTKRKEIRTNYESGAKTWRCTEGIRDIRELENVTSVKLKKSPTPPRIFRASSECLRNFSPHI